MLKYGYLLVFLMILAGCAVEKLPMKPAMDEMAEQPTPAVSSSSVRTPAVPGSLPAVPDDQFGSEKVLPVDVAVSVEESRLRQTDSEKELLDAETLADNRVLQGVRSSRHTPACPRAKNVSICGGRSRKPSVLSCFFSASKLVSRSA